MFVWRKWLLQRNLITLVGLSDFIVMLAESFIAELSMISYPKVADSNTYVDDFLFWGDNEDEANSLLKDADFELLMGNFKCSIGLYQV